MEGTEAMKATEEVKAIEALLNYGSFRSRTNS